MGVLCVVIANDVNSAGCATQTANTCVMIAGWQTKINSFVLETVQVTLVVSNKDRDGGKWQKKKQHDAVGSVSPRC